MTETPVSPQKFAEGILRDRYLNVWPIILGPWTSYLIAARAEFDGDMDKMVVLAVIGLMSTADFRALDDAGKVVGYDDLLVPDFKSTVSRAINVESIAQYSGIPRETVRRKVLQLIEKGWVRRDEDLILAVTPKAAEELKELGGRLFKLIGVIYQALESKSRPNRTRSRDRRGLMGARLGPFAQHVGGRSVNRRLWCDCSVRSFGFRTEPACACCRLL